MHGTSLLLWLCLRLHTAAVQARSHGNELDAAVSLVLEYASNPRPLDPALPARAGLTDDKEQVPAEELLGRRLQLQAQVQLLPSLQVRVSVCVELREHMAATSCLHTGRCEPICKWVFCSVLDCFVVFCSSSGTARQRPAAGAGAGAAMLSGGSVECARVTWAAESGEAMSCRRRSRGCTVRSLNSTGWQEAAPPEGHERSPAGGCRRRGGADGCPCCRCSQFAESSATSEVELQGPVQDQSARCTALCWKQREMQLHKPGRQSPILHLAASRPLSQEGPLASACTHATVQLLDAALPA